MSLKSEEIQSLLDHYSSESSKLKFQADQIKATIKELREQLKAVKAAEKANQPKSPGRGRPKRTTTAAKKAATGRRGRPKKTETAATAEPEAAVTVTEAPKRRGRPALPTRLHRPATICSTTSISLPWSIKTQVRRKPSKGSAPRGRWKKSLNW